MFKTTLLAAFGFFCAASAIAAQAPVPTFPTAAELLTPRALLKGPAPAQYIVAFGRVLGKKTAKGYTRFEYANGQLITERLPSGVVGTYSYSPQGRFDGIQYTDGQRVKAIYDAAGRLTELKGGAYLSRTARIKGKVNAGQAGKEQLAGFLTLQEGISAMDYGDRVCIENDDEPCIITIDGGGDDQAGTGGGATYYPRYYSGGGGGQPGSNSPGFYPATGTAYPNKESCRANVCMGGSRDFREACALMALNAFEYRRCSDKVADFYFKCQESCGTADWAWLESFNFFW